MNKNNLYICSVSDDTRWYSGITHQIVPGPENNELVHVIGRNTTEPFIGYLFLEEYPDPEGFDPHCFFPVAGFDDTSFFEEKEVKEKEILIS